MRKLIIAGNWKMNKTFQEQDQFIKELKSEIKILQQSQLLEDKKVMIFAPSLYISEMVKETSEDKISIGAQNCHHEGEGAYTGEISASMLVSCGIEYVLIGHSERREYFNEDNQLLAKKMSQALQNGITPIFCCGESLEKREDGSYFDWISTQIKESLFQLNQYQMAKTIIAYEPIWAIGTGKVASPEQAQEIHAFIRREVAKQFGIECANKVHILYGGSVKPDNSGILFSQEDIDGGLIGGASLKISDFLAIIKG